MYKAISDTSPLLYLYRIGVIDWLGLMFEEVWIPSAVAYELLEGQHKGYDVPIPKNYHYLNIKDPKSMPSEWLSLDLGPGELSVMSLALENRAHIVLLDDRQARITSQAAGLKVWGTLKIILEAKSQGIIESITPQIDRLNDAGMWISDEIRQRILVLAGEN